MSSLFVMKNEFNNEYNNESVLVSDKTPNVFFSDASAYTEYILASLLILSVGAIFICDIIILSAIIILIDKYFIKHYHKWRHH